MQVARASSGLDSPSPIALKLPPAMVQKAAERLCWISVMCAVTTVVSFSLQNFLQPEMSAMLDKPALRLTLLGLLLLAVGLTAINRFSLVKKETLIDLGVLFQIAVSFAIAMFETSLGWNPNEPVRGLSSVAVWLSLCGLLLPNSPMKAGIAGLLSAGSWPLAYAINLRLYGFAPLPWNRLAIWLFPMFLMAVWMYVLSKRMFKMQLTQQKAEELGSYTLDFMIGKGGMGEVWRAKHKMLARDAAIKLIRPEVLAGVSARQEHVIQRRFEREAKATASLRSPHTVALFDFGKTKDNTFYYVMELLDGIDLQSLVDRYGPMPAGRVVRILNQVCQSLEEAHRAGMVHRDIKPKNIFLARLGLEYDFAKVLDFGLVKTLMREDMSVHTMEGTATGTPAYLSPEIAMGEQAIDGRADLYSLGCVAYFLLTGQMVFTETNPTALAIAHVQKPPVPPSQRTELPIPPALEEIVMQLLEKDPTKRIFSAQELSRRLRCLRNQLTWSEDDAAAWWQTNLPEQRVEIAPPQETPENAGTMSPVGIGFGARPPYQHS